MPVETVFEAKIERVSILDEHGNFDEQLGDGLIPDEDVLAMYKHILVCRHFDEIAFSFARHTANPLFSLQSVENLFL